MPYEKIKLSPDSAEGGGVAQAGEGINKNKKYNTAESREELIEKYGDRVIFLDELDANLVIDDIAEKYGVSRVTAHRMKRTFKEKGFGYAIRNAHEQIDYPDGEWNKKNAERIMRIARDAYIEVRKTRNLPLLKGKQDRVTGDSASSSEDIIQYVVSEVLRRSGSPSMKAKMVDRGDRRVVGSEKRDDEAIPFGFGRVLWVNFLA